jgi:hypothetical protein
MLYDLKLGTGTSLGPGTLGRFSPNNRLMVWIASPTAPFNDGEAMLIDIVSGAKRDLGPGRLANFSDDDHVVVANSGRNDSYVVDLRTGERRDQPDLAGAYPDFGQGLTPDGYRLERGETDARTHSTTFTLVDPAGGAALLRFDAYASVTAGRGALLVASPPQLDGSTPQAGVAGGTTNLFLVDIATGRATFVATTSLDLTFAADGRFAVWTDGYCAPGGVGATTGLFSRDTNKLTHIDARLSPSFTSDGLILDGPFGGSALIDPVTLEYRAAIPARGDSSWSSDHRYASLGQFGGHGGPCA